MVACRGDSRADSGRRVAAIASIMRLMVVVNDPAGRPLRNKPPTRRQALTEPTGRTSPTLRKHRNAPHNLDQARTGTCAWSQAWPNIRPPRPEAAMAFSASGTSISQPT